MFVSFYYRKILFIYLPSNRCYLGLNNCFNFFCFFTILLANFLDHCLPSLGETNEFCLAIGLSSKKGWQIFFPLPDSDSQVLFWTSSLRRKNYWYYTWLCSSIYCLSSSMLTRSNCFELIGILLRTWQGLSDKMVPMASWAIHLTESKLRRCSLSLPPHPLGCSLQSLPLPTAKGLGFHLYFARMHSGPKIFLGNVVRDCHCFAACLFLISAVRISLLL